VTTIPGAGLRRVQVVRVIRNDQIVTFRRDMGKAEDYETEEFAIPGAVPLSNGRWDVIETVERMLWFADGFRAKQSKKLAAQREMPDFKKAWEMITDAKRDARVGRKRFPITAAR